MDLISGPVDQTSSSQVKIALFRSLFRGRDDVYPRRFESRKTGRSGYAPACANEWVRGVCEKPRIKCAECPNRRFLPVTDDVIRWHLSGCDAEGQPFVAGVYPLLQDETCFFLAVDFDKAGWREDAAAFLEACRHLDLPAALERSRSGRGAHVWFFFEEAIPAALARRLGSHVLTETMEGRPDIGLDSYDRLFPNQDTMPHGGFGNLIALPLQRAARKQDNTVFLDSALVPWIDQWAFLASVRKIARSQVEQIVEVAERRGRILGVRLPPQDDDETEPWALPPSRHRRDGPIVGELPSTVEIVLGNQIYMVATVAKDLAQKHRDRLNVDLASRIEFLRQGFFYEQKELVEARSLWSKRRRDGHPLAELEIARIRDLQRAWETRSQDAEQTVLREPALIGVGPVEFLAHVLVRPAANDEESMRYDAELERVAMELVMAHERARGARVHDVHTPELSLQAGLNTPCPGFDVLSHRPQGARRCIEIKGRARQGNIYISTNEWAAAANRREEYWLYVVFDCASASPRLLAVQDPFQKLVEKATGFELNAADIVAAGEHLPLN